MTQKEYKELQEKFYIATEILNQINNAKRELKLYVSHKADILNPCQLNNLKASIPEEEVDKLMDDMRNKIIRNLKASIVNLERKFEEL
jgi:hypothetical protein